MKVVVVIACGISDEPREDLGGRTPLEAARTPHLDAIAARGILGLTRTSPRDAVGGCEVGGLAMLGYDPATCRADGAGLEARGLGLTLGPTDVVLRANLVTFDSTEDGTEVMGDPLGGRLPVAEATEIGRHLASGLGDGTLTVVPGLGHRHLVVWRGGDAGVRTISPYAVADKPVANALPTHEALASLVARSREILGGDVRCVARRERAERVPTALWPWAPGRAVELPPLHDAFGVDGVVVAATAIGRGLGIAAGLTPVLVSDATGDLDTDLAGKVDAALGAGELALVHVGAADLASHAADAQRKIVAIERFDELFVGPLLVRLRAAGDDWRLLVAGDHPTVCATRLHGNEPVPFCVATARDEAKIRTQRRGFAEKDAREQGIFMAEAHTLLERLLRR